MRNVKIHTVYKFRQSLWLAKCIKYNTEQRSKAKQRPNLKNIFTN